MLLNIFEHRSSRENNNRKRNGLDVALVKSVIAHVDGTGYTRQVRCEVVLDQMH